MELSKLNSILVTGGAGYVGSVLVKNLSNSGYNVRVLDSLIFNTEKNFKLFKNNSIEFVCGDIRNYNVLEKCLEGIDCVIHLAAITGPLCDIVPKATRQINEIATHKLVNLCKQKNVKRFFFASTCSNYGSNLKIVNELTPLKSLSLYSETKVNLESVVLNAKDSDFEPCVLRLATAFGISPQMRFDLLLQDLIHNAIVYKKILLFGPDFWRPLIHVKDISKAFIIAIESPTKLISGEIYNVGDNEQNYRKLELAQLIQKFLPKTQIEIQKLKKDPRNYKVSFNKIKNKFGFHSSKTVNDGISEILNGINNYTFDYLKSDFLFRSKLVKKVSVFLKI